MSRWKDNFDSQQPLQKLRAVLDTLQKANTEKITPPNREEYDRAIKILKFLEARFTTLDPELFGPNTWGSFGAWLNTAKSQADVLLTNINSGHLTNINDQLDAIVSIVRQVDIARTVDEAKALAEASAIYRQKIVEELDLVKKRADEIKKQYDSLSSEVSQGKVRLENNDKTIETQKTRLDTAIAEYQKQFSTSQDGWRKDFQTLVTEITDDHKTQLDAIAKAFKGIKDAQKAEWDSTIERTKQESDSYLNFLKGRKKDVDDLYGALGATGLSGNFNNTANTERASADFWRKVAFGFFAAMGVVAAITFGFTFKSDPHWETFLFRLGTAVLLSVPAFYAANESSKHRDREKLIRKNFLELSAIDAYLVHLPETQRNEIKAKLSEKFFGVPEIHEKGEPMNNKDLMGFVENLVKNLANKH